jgi:hypothetical protein
VTSMTTRVTPNSPSRSASTSSERVIVAVGRYLLPPPARLLGARHPHTAGQLGLADIQRRDLLDQLLAVVRLLQHPVLLPVGSATIPAARRSRKARAEANPRAQGNPGGPTARLPASDLETASPRLKSDDVGGRPGPISPRNGPPDRETGDLGEQWSGRAPWAGQSALSAADTMTLAPCRVNLPSSWIRCAIASSVWPPFLTASQVRMAQLAASIPRPSRSLGIRVCSRQIPPHA